MCLWNNCRTTTKVRILELLDIQRKLKMMSRGSFSSVYFAWRKSRSATMHAMQPEKRALVRMSSRRVRKRRCAADGYQGPTILSRFLREGRISRQGMVLKLRLGNARLILASGNPSTRIVHSEAMAGHATQNPDGAHNWTVWLAPSPGFAWVAAVKSPQRAGCWADCQAGGGLSRKVKTALVWRCRCPSLAWCQRDQGAGGSGKAGVAC